MAQQRFSDNFRYCIWKTFGHKCFYCSMPITLKSLEVDHLIPESLPSDRNKFVEAMQAYGLDLSFDVTSSKNLLPSCGPCNTKKHDNLLHPGYIAIALSCIDKKLTELESCVTAQDNEKTLSQILHTVSQALNKGRITSQQLNDGLSALIKTTNLKQVTSAEEEEYVPTKSPAYPPILWSNSALGRFDHDERAYLENSLLEAISNKSFSALPYRSPMAIGERAYEIKTRDGLRLVYTQREGKIVVITCYRRAARRSQSS